MIPQIIHYFQWISNRCNRFIIRVIRDFWTFQKSLDSRALINENSNFRDALTSSPASITICQKQSDGIKKNLSSIWPLTIVTFLSLAFQKSPLKSKRAVPF